MNGLRAGCAETNIDIPILEEEVIMIKSFIIALMAASLVVFASGVGMAVCVMDRTGTVVSVSTMSHGGTSAMVSATGVMDRTGTIGSPSMISYCGTPAQISVRACVSASSFKQM